LALSASGAGCSATEVVASSSGRGSSVIISSPLIVRKAEKAGW
jgi:hypothetical protein